MDDQHTQPCFRTEKGSPPKVFVQCSVCRADLWQMKPGERIDVRRAYFCKQHDPGAIVLNLPTTPKESK